MRCRRRRRYGQNLKAGVRRRFTNHNRDSDKAARRTRRRTPEAATAQAGRRRGRDSVPQRAPDEGRRPLSVTGPARPSQGVHHDPGRRSRSRRVGGGGRQRGRGGWSSSAWQSLLECASEGRGAAVGIGVLLERGQGQQMCLRCFCRA